MTGAIVNAGTNCWRVDRADRFYCIQDAADYFKLVRRALLTAESTIFILGWDIDAKVDLDPDARPGRVPSRLDKLIAHVARRRPQLRCFMLIWDYGALYAFERDPFSRWRLGWRMPRGIRFAFDSHHPTGGSHHQKIVVIDDSLAFCGGIDLTGHRWDRSAHRPDEPKRVTPVGKAYGPYHEIQAMVSGPVAASLGQLARDRWRDAGMDDCPEVASSDRDLWPADITPDVRNVAVGISRTIAELDPHPAVRECETLFHDSIARAERAIYIESQYFTSNDIGAALAKRLEEPDGPEVIVVSPKECHGWIEQTTMGAFRAGVFRNLIAADRHKRLRILCPMASRAAGVPTFIHSKVMVVDDTLARIGSANCAQRSLGVDSECDLAVDAGGDGDARAGIARIRNRLLAEHLGLSLDAVEQEIAAGSSLCALVDRHADSDHTLVRIDIPAEIEEPSELLRAAADPAEPIDATTAIEVVSSSAAPPVSRPRVSWVQAAIGLIGRALPIARRRSAPAVSHRARAEFG